jgi:light-regulated signal transduction histidine kinase (bacteriophytochrome)
MVTAGQESGSMGEVQELHNDVMQEPQPSGAAVQAGAYLLELSRDWIVLRASENIHHLLGESHVTLIDEPLGRFVHAQALHDLRNLFSRLSGTTGIARAYGIRLTDEPELVDVAFQLSGSRVLLEAVPSAGGFGECFGSVGGLIAGLGSVGGRALLDNGARRMRALTGYDRVTLAWGDKRAESTRGAFDAAATSHEELPVILADATAPAVPLFPAEDADSSAAEALLCACDKDTQRRLADSSIRAALRVAFVADGIDGEFRCESRRAREPSFELHAAAELFAQLFAMKLEIARLRSGD